MQLEIYNPETAEDILEPLKAVGAQANDGYLVEVAGVVYEADILRVFVSDDWNDRLPETHVVLRDDNSGLIERTTPEQIRVVGWDDDSPY